MSKPKPIALDQLVQFNLYNPSNPVRGLSPLNAVLSGVKADFKAQQYNEAFFDNGGDPGGTVTTDTLMTSEQIQQYRTQFEDRHVGSDKRGRLAVFPKGWKYEQSRVTHRDMEFIEQRKWHRQEIISAYGVNKFVIGITE